MNPTKTQIRPIWSGPWSRHAQIDSNPGEAHGRPQLKNTRAGGSCNLLYERFPANNVDSGRKYSPVNNPRSCPCLSSDRCTNALPTMNPTRLTRSELNEHLRTEDVHARKTALALRTTVLAAAPQAAEGIKFHVLAYFHQHAFFKSIGGSICMIEVKNGRVVLSFIRGAGLPDPSGLMYGKGKHKRFVDIPDAEFARRDEVSALVRAAAAQETW
jgi:hypothetical protein